MFEEIDALPCAQGEGAADEGNRQLDLGERRADMRGHIVRAFVVVPVEPGVFGRDALEEGLKQDSDKYFQYIEDALTEMKLLKPETDSDEPLSGAGVASRKRS